HLRGLHEWTPPDGQDRPLTGIVAVVDARRLPDGHHVRALLFAEVDEAAQDIGFVPGLHADGPGGSSPGDEALRVERLPAHSRSLGVQGEAPRASLPV